MTSNRIIVVCKDKQTAEDASKILVASGKISFGDIEYWEEKTWDVKRKSGPVSAKLLIIGDIKDTESLSCFIDILYERWGICYGMNERYALIKADNVFIKDADRYNAFMEEYNEVMAPILPPVTEDTKATKVAKTVGTVGLAVATGGASLAAQKIYDDNKTLTEKNTNLCLYGLWHFANNYLEEFLSNIEMVR
ncbi:MAG: hypothetical protein IKF09_00745 [Clostridiales bacterium]|nr:hypothetical protein [Clostridiales bacterium]